MNVPLINNLSQHIRIVDGRNEATPKALGELISNWLDNAGHELPREPVIAFVERTNPDKQMGAGRLAELIVDEFDLDDEG